MENEKIKDSNPKDACGIKKVQFSTIPSEILLEISSNLKNQRENLYGSLPKDCCITSTEYYNNILLQLMCWWEGNDNQNIIKILSLLVLLRESMLNNILDDDRPECLTIVNIVLMNKKTEELIVKYPNPLDAYIEKNNDISDENILNTNDISVKNNDNLKIISNMSLFPVNVLMEIAIALTEGARKYGRHNYRAIGVRASVYYDATLRHIFAWWSGEDIDPDSGLSHITKAIASLVVLRDAMINNKWTDDRPPKVDNKFIKSFTFH